jgi:RNA polymerase sigma-70 factor (ECF subfamily)
MDMTHAASRSTSVSWHHVRVGALLGNVAAVVMGMFAMIPEEQRVAITLVDLAGLSTAEAARAMGTPRGTVLSRLHRGRRGLAALLWTEVRGVEER